ncbi:AraC family transcriptional regulator [Paenibacillus thailandensis]|uniref:AraC family transcriptional regulator n=1 Tax=Paenibacillus thailandensis TaxID=393250 RepID=A0ABW5R393_9BACL
MNGYLYYPESLGRYADFPRHRERRDHGIPYYNLHLVMAGSGYVIHGGNRIALGEGDGFLYPPGAKQHYGTYANRPWDVRWIHFYAAASLPLTQAADSSAGYFFSFGGRERLVELSDTMLTLCERFETRHEPRLSALVYEALAELSVNSKPLEGSLPLSKQSDIRAIADQIRSRCGEPWSLERMAALSGYSSYHFLRLFQSVIGKTPNQYLTLCRIAGAKRLLVTTKLPVKAIGGMVGFAQASYFIQLFKRSEGLSPKEYRDMYG